MVLGRRVTREIEVETPERGGRAGKPIKIWFDDYLNRLRYILF